MEEITHFNINHLKFFFDAASLGSVSKAARKNLVSQSAISQGIKSLEGALNCQLLEHRKSRFALTLKGEKVFVEARSIMRSLVSLQQKIKLENHEPSGHLFFGISEGLAHTFLADVYVQCQNLYPSLGLHARYGPFHSLRESLLRGSLEMTLCFRPALLPDCQFVSLGKGFLRVYRSPEFRGNLKDYGVMVPETSDADLSHVDEKLKTLFGDSGGIKKTLPGFSMVSRLTSLGTGFGLLPDFIVSGQKQNFQAVDANTLRFPYEIGVVHLARKALSENHLAFVELFRNNILCNNILI